MGGTNGHLGALLQEALADEERRLELLEARLAALRGQQQPPSAPSASDSTQAIWAALATGPSARTPTASMSAPVAPAPVPAPAPPPAPEVVVAAPVTAKAEAAADAEDWAALASPEAPAPSATAYAAAAAAVEDPKKPTSPDLDPRLEAARRLLLQSGQGLQELKTVLARVPGWDDASAAGKDPSAPEPEEEAFWSPPSTQAEAEAEHDEPAAPEVPARDRPTRTRAGDASLFGLDRAFRGDAPALLEGEPAWARDLRARQERGAEVLGRVEELLLELGKTIATVLEMKSARSGDSAALEARAERAERECDGLRRAVAERAERIARLEALVESVMVAAPATAPPAPSAFGPAMATPRGTRRPSGSLGPAPAPSEALRRTLLGSSSGSGEHSRRALQALEPIAQEDDGDRARLRQSLAALGAQHAALLDRLVRLLES